MWLCHGIPSFFCGPNQSPEELFLANSVSVIERGFCCPSVQSNDHSPQSPGGITKKRPKRDGWTNNMSPQPTTIEWNSMTVQQTSFTTPAWTIRRGAITMPLLLVCLPPTPTTLSDFFETKCQWGCTTRGEIRQVFDPESQRPQTCTIELQGELSADFELSKKTTCAKNPRSEFNAVRRE